LVAVPVIASMKELVSYLYRKVLGSDPFPAAEETPSGGPASIEQTVRSWLARLRVIARRAARRAGSPADVEPPHDRKTGGERMRGMVLTPGSGSAIHSERAVKEHL
jgi:hypothetical protein